MQTPKQIDSIDLHGCGGTNLPGDREIRQKPQKYTEERA